MVFIGFSLRTTSNWVHIYTFNKGEIVKFYEYSDTATISLVLSSSEESLNN
jgi:ketosteroid isomerase-like protein